MTRPFDSIMLRTLMGPLVGATQLFALYVLIHGHYSPGGGFQGGVLVAAGIILPMLIFGRDGDCPPGIVRIGPTGSISIAAIGVLIFFGTGLYSLLFGNPLMNYADLPLSSDPAMRRSYSILIIEIGVTLAVAGGVLSIFHSLYGDSPQNGEVAA